MISVRLPPVLETCHKAVSILRPTPKHIHTDALMPGSWALLLGAADAFWVSHVVPASPKCIDQEGTRQGSYHRDNHDVMSEYKGALSFPRDLEGLSSRV